MKKLLLTLLVSVAAVGFSFAEEAAPNAQAAAPKAHKALKVSKASKSKDLTLKGTVESVGVAANTIKVKSGKGAAQEIRVGNALMTKGEKKIGVTEVAVGDSVIVEFVQKDGNVKTKSIKVLTAKVPTAKKKAAKK
jgi:hypothetical protein